MNPTDEYVRERNEEYERWMLEQKYQLSPFIVWNAAASWATGRALKHTTDLIRKFGMAIGYLKGLSVSIECRAHKPYDDLCEDCDRHKRLSKFLAEVDRQ